MMDFLRNVNKRATIYFQKKRQEGAKMERALNLHPFYDKGDILKNDQALPLCLSTKNIPKQGKRAQNGSNE